MIGLMLALSAIAAEPCVDDVATSEVAAQLEEAALAYQAMDVAAFHDALDNVDSNLGCVREPLDAGLAARTHRMFGLRAYANRDREAAMQAFAAARNLEPKYTFPEALVPPNNEIHTIYQALATEDGHSEEVAPAREGRLLFDGRAGIHRPLDWPTLFQWVADDDVVLRTEHVAPGEAMPQYAISGGREKRRAAARPLFIVGGVATGTAIGLYGGAAATEARLMGDSADTATDPGAEIAKMRKNANALYGSSVAVGGAAMAAATSGLLLFVW